MADGQVSQKIALNPAEWVDAHGDALFRFALARVRDREVAQELVQEAFLAALAGRERFAGEATERTWLTGILKYKVIDHFRRRRGAAVGQSEQTEADGLVEGWFQADGHWKEPPGEWRVAENLAERAEFWGVLEECLGALPDKTRQAFVLRVMDEARGEEVCQALGISATNLWALLHRARARLRKCLEVKWFGSERERM